METSALTHLMGAYLHQDFDVVGTVADNVDLFVDDEPELAADLSREIASLLAHDLSDAAIASLLDTMGCGAMPPAGEGYREWLGAMAHEAETRLAARGSGRHPN